MKNRNTVKRSQTINKLTGLGGNNLELLGRSSDDLYHELQSKGYRWDSHTQVWVKHDKTRTGHKLFTLSFKTDKESYDYVVDLARKNDVSITSILNRLIQFLKHDDQAIVDTARQISELTDELLDLLRGRQTKK